MSGEGCGLRLRDKIGTPGFDFDAAVTGTGDQFLVGMGKQKEAEAKENDEGRCRDNAERDEVEQGADIRLRCPDAVTRGIGERTRSFFGKLWTRVSGRAAWC